MLRIKFLVLSFKFESSRVKIQPVAGSGYFLHDKVKPPMLIDSNKRLPLKRQNPELVFGSV